MNSERRQGEREGEKRGIAIGEERGIALTKQFFKLNVQGKSIAEIASLCDLTVEKVKEILG